MEKLYEGKSKVVYSSEEPGTCIIKYKDTATAGNGVKKEDLPGKGKLNAAISNIIFDYLMKNGIKTHLLKVIDETTVLAKKAEIVMVEVIVRNIAAGSFSKKYGVPEGSPLKNTVVEFSYKSDELGDPMIKILIVALLINVVLAVLGGVGIIKEGAPVSLRRRSSMSSEPCPSA